MSVVLLSLLIFELIQKAALNFILFLNIFKISKSYFEHFEKKIPCLVGCSFLKSFMQTFRIAKC